MNETDDALLDRVEKAREELRKALLPWADDDYHPSNLVRKDGLGNEVARVDRWCGGFQDSLYPVTIGWEVRLGILSDSGVVSIRCEVGKADEPIILTPGNLLTPGMQEDYRIAVQRDMAAACVLADDALIKLRKDTDRGGL